MATFWTCPVCGFKAQDEEGRLQHDRDFRRETTHMHSRLERATEDNHVIDSQEYPYTYSG